jgi:hypothetical protein
LIGRWIFKVNMVDLAADVPGFGIGIRVKLNESYLIDILELLN